MDVMPDEVKRLKHLLTLSEQVHRAAERLYLCAGNPDHDLLVAGLTFQTALRNYKEAKEAKWQHSMA